LRSITPSVASPSRRDPGALLRLAQQFVDPVKESDDGRTFLALELPRDPEELLEQRTDRAVDDRPPAPGGLEHHSAAVAWMRTAGDEAFSFESVGEPGHGAGAHTERLGELGAGDGFAACGAGQDDELGRTQLVRLRFGSEEVLEGSGKSAQAQDHLLRRSGRRAWSVFLIARHIGLGRFRQP
jgi:hypothetical protein